MVIVNVVKGLFVVGGVDVVVGGVDVVVALVFVCDVLKVDVLDDSVLDFVVVFSVVVSVDVFVVVVVDVVGTDELDEPFSWLAGANKLPPPSSPHSSPRHLRCSRRWQHRCCCCC